MRLQDVLSELGKELKDTKARVGEGVKSSNDLEAQLEVCACHVIGVILLSILLLSVLST